MTQISYILASLLVVFVQYGGSCQNTMIRNNLATSNSPKSTGISPDDEVKLASFLERKMKKAGLVGMQVAFVSGGQYTWQGNFGVQEYNTPKLVDDRSLFMIASCSKPVTALAVLTLIDDGKIRLDDPINLHLPFQVRNPNYPDDPITIRMLLAHVSSLKDNWSVLTPLYTIEQGGGDSPIPLKKFLMDYLTEGGTYYHREENFTDKAPSTEYRYCNVGYALLGYLVEHISGQPFKDAVQSKIFDPLEMHNTYWFLADIPHDNIAKPHDLPDKKNDLSATRIFNHYGYPDYPDGQIRTTASDYGLFLSLILNDGQVNGQQIISSELMREFLKIQYPEVNKHQAIAWNYNEFDNFIYYLLMPRLPSHTGADPGVATAVSFDPKKKNAAIIFTNSPPTRFLDQKIFYQEIMKRLLREAKRIGH